MCNDLCQKYRTTRVGPARQRYFGNVKWCNHCQVRMEWDGRYCPCCGIKLSGRAKNNDSWRRNSEMVRRIA